MSHWHTSNIFKWPNFRLAVTQLRFPIQICFSATVPQLVFPSSLFTLESINCIFHPVAVNFDLRTWSNSGQDEPECCVSRSDVISFKSYRSDTQHSRPVVVPVPLNRLVKTRSAGVLNRQVCCIRRCVLYRWTEWHNGDKWPSRDNEWCRLWQRWHFKQQHDVKHARLWSRGMLHACRS